MRERERERERESKRDRHSEYHTGDCHVIDTYTVKHEVERVETSHQDWYEG